MDDLASRLTAAREGIGLSQEELADRAGCGQSTIGHLESRARGSSKHLVAIARALGVRPEWLVEGKLPKNPAFELSQKDLFLIQAYRDASPAGRQLIELACIGASKPEPE